MLALESVCRYYGGVRAVDDVSFEIASGEIVGLIGPNGSGKTSVLDLISGFTPLTRGEIRFEGMNISHYEPHQIAKLGIRRTFQTTNLFSSMTVLEQMMAAAHLCVTSYQRSRGFRIRTHSSALLEDMHEVLEFVGINVNQRTWLSSRLSTADQRKLMVALALVGHPKLLLLDEPSAGMVEEERSLFGELIKKIQVNGVTILLVEHHMKLLAAVCNRMVVLNFGRVIAEGIPNTVQQNSQVIEAYLGTRS